MYLVKNMINYNLYHRVFNPLMEAARKAEGNVEEFLKLGSVDVYDESAKAIITIETKDFVKVVNDALFRISSEYKFFYTYIKYSKIFYIPNYPSKLANTMAVDGKKNLWMNVHFIYNACKMNKDRVFGIIFHELMHNLLKHQEREEKVYPIEHRTKEHHMKCNICQDFEVNGSMVTDNVVTEDFWTKMNGLYKKDYVGKRWEDLLHSVGDKEYEDWLARSGVKLSDKTKEALDAIERALKTLSDPDSTDAEKERAKETLKRKMDEMYGKKDKKVVDKADYKGLKRELERLMDSRLGDIGDIASNIQNVIDDMTEHPKDMTEHDIAVLLGDFKNLKGELIKNASKISSTFRKDEDEVKMDVNKAIKSVFKALDVLHEGVDIKTERKVIRQAKDDLENIILNEIDKRKREEKREREIAKHKEKLEKEKREKEKSEKSGSDEKSDKGDKDDKPKKSKEELAKEKIERLKKKNPVKKFVDTFKNLQELIKIDRISNETFETLGKSIEILDKIVEVPVQDMTLADIKGVVDLIPTMRKNSTKDLQTLVDKKILKWDKDKIDSFIKDVYDALDKFFKVLIDEDEPSSVKFGAMSLAIEELRNLGKKLKSQKKITPSEEWKKSYKETRERLIKIYKKEGKFALKSELEKLGVKI